jgi:hypothetical protein
MSTATSGGMPEASPAKTEANVAKSDAAPSTANSIAPNSPFADERDVLYDPAAIRDELSQAQASPSAARKLSGRHFARLIYSLQYEPGAVERHTAPYSISAD